MAIDIPDAYTQLPEHDQLLIEQQAHDATVQRVAHLATITAELQAGRLSPDEETVALGLLDDDVTASH